MNLDEYYSYDGLNRLTDSKRGLLATSGGTVTLPPSLATGTKTFEEQWTLDALGNFSNFKQGGAGTWTLDQDRQHDTTNALTGFTTNQGTPWATPAYDAAGNMTTMPQPNNPANSYTAKFDAWNRLGASFRRHDHRGTVSLRRT